MLAYAVDPTDAPQSIYIWSRRGIASEEMSGDTKTKNGTTKLVGAMKWSTAYASIFMRPVSGEGRFLGRAWWDLNPRLTG